MDLRSMQDWIVARQLIGTPGIAEVNSFGGFLKQYEVAVDPMRLKAMNITIPEIFEALEKIMKIQVVLISKNNKAVIISEALGW